MSDTRGVPRRCMEHNMRCTSALKTVRTKGYRFLINRINGTGGVGGWGLGIGEDAFDACASSIFDLRFDTCVVFSLFWFLLHGLTIDPHFRKSSTVTGTMSTAKNVCISFHQCPCNIVYLFNGACSWLEVKKKSSMNVSIPTTCTRHRMTLELYSTLCICTNPRCTTHLPCSRPRGWTIVRIPQLWVHTTPQKRR
jgi:hypothetical protein